jgi:anthraniloyl-CoA monooxygenase
MGEQGVMPAEAVEIAKAFKSAGVDLIDVSSGETAPAARPVYGRMFQTPLSDRIRNEANCATMTVGNIYEPDHVNSILAAGRADLVALGKPHLADPSWTLRAAARAGYRGLAIPPVYIHGQEQLARTLQRESETA